MANSRGGFTNKIGFIAAAAGSAVGLGNIWKFPYETGANGGAAFLLIYLCCAFLIGFPVMMAEIALGRKTGLNPYGAYASEGNKRWALAGLFGVISGFMILTFYNVVAGWAFGYFLQISFGDLLSAENFGAFFGGYVADYTDNMIYSILFMIVTAIIVARGVSKGIEMAAKVLMPTLIFLLILLIIYALTLDNALDGIRFYLVPDFSEINGKTVYSAMGQAFFSLSLGMGALITYGSYVSKNDNIVNSAVIVTLADTMIAFMAGMLIFPLVFSQGMEPSAGPGLVFVALPGIFQSMGPVIGKVIGGAFFLLLCFAALTSTISLLEVPVAYLVDEKKWNRKRSVAILAGSIFLCSLPCLLSQGAVEFFTDFMHYEGSSKSFLDLVADLFSEIGLPLGGCLLTLFIAVKWKTSQLSAEIAIGYPSYQGSTLEKYVNIMITFICPVILGVMFITTLLQKFFNVALF